MDRAGGGHGGMSASIKRNRITGQFGQKKPRNGSAFPRGGVALASRRRGGFRGLLAKRRAFQSRFGGNSSTKIAQRLAALRELEGNLAPLLALYGLPFIPAGMEGTGTRGKSVCVWKGGEKKGGLRASPFPPSVCVLLT